MPAVKPQPFLRDLGVWGIGDPGTEVVGILFASLTGGVARHGCSLEDLLQRLDG